VKKTIFALLFAACFVSVSFAQTDQITLTTYYPAPFGMYQEMRVMGKLGVGTTNPSDTVHVVGTDNTKPLYATVEHTGSQDVYLYLKRPTAANSSNIQFGNPGSLGLLSYASGNQFLFNRKVGIGTTNVDALMLDVYNNNALGSVAKIAGAYYSTEFAKLDTSSGSSLYYGADIQALGSAVNPGWPGVGLRINVPSKALIVESGKVGIGTTNPVAPVHIEHNPSENIDLYVNGVVGIGSTQTYSAPFNVTDSTAWEPAAVIKKTGTGAGLGILHNDPVNNVPNYKALYIYANGAEPYQAIYQDGGSSNYFGGPVGIGVASPQYSLDVGCTGSTCTESMIKIKSNGSIAMDGHLIVGSATNTSNAYVNGYVQLYFADSTVCNANRVGAIRLAPMPVGGGSNCPLEICYPGKESPAGSSVYSWKGSCNPVYWNGVTPPGGGTVGVVTGNSIE